MKPELARVLLRRCWFTRGHALKEHRVGTSWHPLRECRAIPARVVDASYPLTRSAVLRNKSYRRAVDTIALQGKVPRRVGAGQVEIGDVGSLSDLKEPAGAIGLGPGRGGRS